MKAQDVPELPEGWRRSANGGAHKRTRLYSASVAVGREGYSLTVWRREDARHFDDALAEADEILEAMR